MFLTGIAKEKNALELMIPQSGAHTGNYDQIIWLQTPT